MTESIKLADVYDKNLNFLIGSGASVGLFPTLALKIKDSFGSKHTIESLATLFDQTGDRAKHDYLFLHYYKTCIRLVQNYSPSDTDDEAKKKVLDNYEEFLRTILQILKRRRPLDKRCNLFTTNYDGCFVYAADNILKKGADDFVFNDGARGFRTRHLQAQNFNTYLCKTGVFERSQTSVPQVNLIHLHGSIYWKKSGSGVLVDYNAGLSQDLIGCEKLEESIDAFSSILGDEAKLIEDLNVVPLLPEDRDAFWNSYNSLPIVNPTKWKFHETVFEEHYYQMLRLLSYELEKPNSVLVTFGFSFADEHILNLIKRSLSNPSLQVYVCCYTMQQKEWLSQVFASYDNVVCIALDEGVMDFSAFNEKVFTTSASANTSSTQAAGHVDPFAVAPTSPSIPPLPDLSSFTSPSGFATATATHQPEQKA